MGPNNMTTPMHPHPIVDAKLREAEIHLKLDKLADAGEMSDVPLEMAEALIDDALVMLNALYSEFPVLAISEQSHGILSHVEDESK